MTPAKDGRRRPPPDFRKLGCKVDELFCEMDGRFPNHHPDPTLPEAMASLIAGLRRRDRSWAGLDGDGDRIGVVDDEGHLIWGDQLLIFFARDILKEFPGRRSSPSQATKSCTMRSPGSAEMRSCGRPAIR